MYYGSVAYGQYYPALTLPTINEPSDAQGVQAVVLDVDGNTRLGLLPVINTADTEEMLDRIGNFELIVPASHPAVTLLAQRRQLLLRKTGEGYYFKGIIEEIGWDDSDKTTPGTVTVRGSQHSRELVRPKARLGTEYINVAPSTVIAAEIARPATPWSISLIDGGLSNVMTRYDGSSPMQNVLGLSAQLNRHVRFSPTARTLDFGSFGEVTSTLLINPEAMTPTPGLPLYSSVALIKAVRVLEESSKLVNRVFPLGAGEANNRFGLGSNLVNAVYTTRIAPYTVHSLLGPKGDWQYYIEDAASQASYGLEEEFLNVKDVGPLSESAGAFELAANAIYDIASTYLARNSQPQTTYEVDVVTLTPWFSVGNVFPVRYKGIVTEPTGKRVYKSINANLVVLSKRRTIGPDGITQWKLLLSTVAKWRETDQELIVGAIEDLANVKVSVKPYTHTRTFVGARQSIQNSGSKWATLQVRISDRVRYVLDARFNLQLFPLKSSVTTTSDPGSTSSGASSVSTTPSGGSSTSGASSTSTTPSGGGATSGASSTSTSGTGGHQHTVPAANFAGSTAGPSGTVFVSTFGHGHTETGVSTLGDTVSTTVPNSTHTHSALSASGSSVSATTSTESAGAHSHNIDHTHSTPAHQHNIDHTHSTPNHSHNIDHTHSISGHTHALVYGIFESTLPAAPQVTIWKNGVQIYGPTDANVVEADFAQYFQDAQGRPIWGTHTLEIRKAASSPDTIDVIPDIELLLVATALEPS